MDPISNGATNGATNGTNGTPIPAAIHELAHHRATTPPPFTSLAQHPSVLSAFTILATKGLAGTDLISFSVWLLARRYFLTGITNHELADRVEVGGEGEGEGEGESQVESALAIAAVFDQVECIRGEMGVEAWGTRSETWRVTHGLFQIFMGRLVVPRDGAGWLWRVRGAMNFQSGELCAEGEYVRDPVDMAASFHATDPPGQSGASADDTMPRSIDDVATLLGQDATSLSKISEDQVVYDAFTNLMDAGLSGIHNDINLSSFHVWIVARHHFLAGSATVPTTHHTTIEDPPSRARAHLEEHYSTGAAAIVICFSGAERRRRELGMAGWGAGIEGWSVYFRLFQLFLSRGFELGEWVWWKVGGIRRAMEGRAGEICSEGLWETGWLTWEQSA